MTCFEHECPDCVGCITQRVAVDIPGEDERIRRRLLETEQVFRRLAHEVNRRVTREGRVIAQRPDDGLADSPCLTALLSACESLEQAERQLTVALVASGTMTDQPPF